MRGLGTSVGPSGSQSGPIVEIPGSSEVLIIKNQLASVKYVNLTFIFFQCREWVARERIGPFI